MAKWIEFETTDLGYYDPRTGRDLSSITGRENRPGLDPFEHLGIVYPDIAQESSKPKRLEWYEKGRRLLIKVSISEVEANDIIASGKFKAKRLTDQEAEQVILIIEGGS